MQDTIDIDKETLLIRYTRAIRTLGKFSIAVQLVFLFAVDNRIKPITDSPSIGVVDMVLAIQPDRLRVQLDRLLVLLGGEVLVAKPGWKFDLSEERNGRRTSKDKKYIRWMKSSFPTQQGNPPAERGHDNNNEGNSTPPIVDFGCMRNAQPKENELETWRDLAIAPEYECEAL